MRAAAARIGGETARLDAELLLAHALGCTREALLLGGLDRAIDMAAFEALVTRRVGGEPVAYIVGRREFWSLDLIVTPDVLIPRADSETLIEAAVAAIPADAGLRVLDLGTGSGALLLATLAQWRLAWGVGVDRSAAALAVAARNADALGLAARAAFVQADWAAAIGGGWDLVLANPPYVRNDAPLARDVRDYEPAAALFAGEDGLDAYRALLPDLPRLLGPTGLGIIEIGSEQGSAVAAMARALGMAVDPRNDLAGRERALCLRVSAD